MSAEILRILLLLLQLGFLALLYLVLWSFARALLRDLRSAEQTQLDSRTGIGRLAVLESPDDEPPVGHTVFLGPINSIGRDVNSTIYVEGGPGTSRTRAAPTGPMSTGTASTGRWRSPTGTS
jgi:hypothetical protein